MKYGDNVINFAKRKGDDLWGLISNKKIVNGACELLNKVSKFGEGTKAAIVKEVKKLTANFGEWWAKQAQMGIVPKQVAEWINRNGVKELEEEIGEKVIKESSEEIGEKLTAEAIEDKLQKYICDSFEGTGRELQDNFNDYLRENVWCNESLSNAEKIKIMQANFEKLTPEQKVNFNVLNNEKVLRNPDYSNWGAWPDVAWPDFPGLNKATAKGVYNKETGIIEIPSNLDRIGSPYGNNLGVVENGYHCTQGERAICYIENEYARNNYHFDTTYYKEAIDAIKEFDKNNPEKAVEQINNIIEKLNKQNGTNNSKVTEAMVASWKQGYDAFQTDELLVELCANKGIDSTYGVIGEAAPWIVNGEMVASGGAGQLNIPISVKALEDIGIIKNIGSW